MQAVERPETHRSYKGKRAQQANRGCAAARSAANMQAVERPETYRSYKGKRAQQANRDCAPLAQRQWAHCVRPYICHSIMQAVERPETHRSYKGKRACKRIVVALRSLNGKGRTVCAPQLVKKLFWDAEGGVPYKIIYEE